MNVPLSPKTLSKRAAVATTVFQSGNGQAVRIPKEFQFSTKHVEIRREGQALVLRPVALTAAEALADLPPLGVDEARALDRAMANVDDLLPLDEPEEVAPKAAMRRKRR
ncbi:MAG: AbrB/MazE/SpoVT family DNA-binding domain-containing protein [Hydrogenophaga sp.]|jgi:antitoxin VapB|nr:AbrB/MazE/SpoVT family DNA-binding domain-containing protein [Hydrogenophaga sp.]